MGKNYNPRNLLSRTIKLISRDIDAISAKPEIDSDYSQRLVRYCAALLNIVKDDETRDDSERNRLAKMSTQELAEKAKKILK